MKTIFIAMNFLLGIFIPAVGLAAFGDVAHYPAAAVLGVIVIALGAVCFWLATDALFSERLEERATLFAAVEPEVTAAPAPSVAEPDSRMKGIGLFFAAPFIGLAFLAATPIIGFGKLLVGPLVALAVLVRYGTTVAARKVFRSEILKRIGLAIVAPFIGLVFVMVMPYIGIGTLIWVGVRAIPFARWFSVRRAERFQANLEFVRITAER
ncbi:MAG: hypothetical protein HXX19_11865 [Rhodoferax sp.]|nr:hypothetical protein [Rhodoferax sp.]